MTTKIGLSVIFAVAVLVGGQAYATVINVDFETNTAAANSHSVTYSGQGVITATGNTWNSVHGSGGIANNFWGDCDNTTSIASTTLVDSEGNSTGVSVSASGLGQVYQYLGYSAETANVWSDHQELMNDWLIQYSEVDNSTVTISGLTANGSYNLVVYGHSHEGGGNTVFSIGGVEKTTSTVTTTGSHALTAGYDYMTYNNVNADASGNIAILFHDAVGGNQGGFNGFQITSVPEPSAMGLAACGLLSLLAYAWRKRK